MKRIEQTYSIKAPVAQVWQAFVDPQVIGLWGGGPATIDDKANSKFSMWGGDIHGTNTKVVRQKLLEQNWYSGDTWPMPSKVSFSFEMNGDETTVKLVHEGVPDVDVKSIEQGWKDYYLGPIKELLEQ